MYTQGDFTTSVTTFLTILITHITILAIRAMGDSLRVRRSGNRIPVWGLHFLHRFRPALGPTQLPIQWVPSLVS